MKIEFINNFGVTPHRILNETVKLKTSNKFKLAPGIILEQSENIFFTKYQDTILILYKDKKDKGKTKKILSWEYTNTNNNNNKHTLNCGFLKQLQKTKIEDSENKMPIYKPCYSMCTFFKFGKLFILTCRYLGNIFKIQCNWHFIS